MTGVSRKQAAWVALILLALGAALRLAGVGIHSLWLDEATSLQFARHDLQGCLWAEVNNPPLHRLLIHLWIRLLGDGSDGGLRLLAAAFGSLAGVVFWALARRVLPPVAALVALALFVLDPYHLLLSQELRAYSLLVLLTLLAWWLHLDSLSPGTRLWRALGLAAVLTAGLYTHYQFAWVALVIGGHRVLRAWASSWRERLRLLAPLAAAAAAFAPWAWIFVTQVGAQYRGYTTNLPGRILSLPFMLLLGESAAVRQYPESYAQAAARHWWLLGPFALAVVPLLVVGARDLWRRETPGRFLLVAAAVPLLALIALFAWMPLFTARYLAFLIPVLCLLLAAGAVALTWRRLGAVLVGVVLVLQLVSLGRYHLDPRFGREDWRGAAAWVSAREQKGDVILFDHHYVRIPFDRYHRGTAGKVGVPGDAPGRADLMRQLRRNPPARLFLVLSHHWDRRQQSVNALEKGWCCRESRVFRPSNGIEVHLFERCGNSGIRR